MMGRVHSAKEQRLIMLSEPHQTPPRAPAWIPTFSSHSLTYPCSQGRWAIELSTLLPTQKDLEGPPPGAAEDMKETSSDALTSQHLCQTPAMHGLVPKMGGA